MAQIQLTTDEFKEFAVTVFRRYFEDNGLNKTRINPEDCYKAISFVEEKTSKRIFKSGIIRFLNLGWQENTWSGLSNDVSESGILQMKQIIENRGAGIPIANNRVGLGSLNKSDIYSRLSQ